VGQFIRFQSFRSYGPGALVARPVSLWQAVHERRRSEWERTQSEEREKSREKLSAMILHLRTHAAQLEERRGSLEVALSWRVSHLKELTEKLSAMGESAPSRDRVVSSIRTEEGRIDDTRRMLKQVNEKILQTRDRLSSRQTSSDRRPGD
jgi:peptidoglycan hydrolase CwlO-like protein